MLNQKSNQSLPVTTTQQKTAVAFLLTFVVLIFVLGLRGIGKTINSASDYGVPQQKIAFDDIMASTTEEAMKQVDTDKDGLSDWDEINIYHTSPYLPDTDGDGFSDGTEVKNNKNPLCPEGKDCTVQGQLINKNWSGAASSSDPTAATTNTTQNPTFTAEQQQQMAQIIALAGLQNGQTATATVPVATGGAKLTDDAQAKAILSGGANIATIRQALISAGMDKTQLDQISDEILLKNYSALLQKNP
jgi:hypothetical protein